MYHNHVSKDYSHPWYTEQRKLQSDEYLYRFFDKYKILRAFMPLYGWFVYLIYVPDGSHFIPIASHRLWKESYGNEPIKCIISTIVVICNFIFIYYLCGNNFFNFIYYYFIPLMVQGWWLTCVTYLQHHDEDTLVYNDSNWKFVDAAFQTVDRTYGIAIDHLSHHITDCHLIHHLFFTKIPHYNLPNATIALKKYLKDYNIESMYKYKETYDFAWLLHKYFYTFGFDATLSTDNATGTESPVSVSVSASMSDVDIASKLKEN